MIEERKPRILVVDDDPAIRRAIERVLSPLYWVEAAEGAVETRARIQAAPFAVALIDVQLQDGNGYALCQEVRTTRPETDVILMTGSLSEPDEKLLRALEEGAFYFLFKPFEKRVLKALIARALELQDARRALERHARELAEDLNRARRFQKSLFPRRPLRESGWHVEGKFEACEALGGDFYFVTQNADDTIAVAMSDVVGHGVSAAMYAGMLRSILDAARRRDPEPASVLSEIQDGIDFFDGARYASLVYALLFPDGRVRYFNAGHPPLFWRDGRGEIRKLDSTGLILTSVLARSDETREIRLGPGDRLLVFTDGVYEARDPSEHELGRDALAALLNETRSLDVTNGLLRFVERLKTHASGRPLADDATLLIIERLH